MEARKKRTLFTSLFLLALAFPPFINSLDNPRLAGLRGPDILRLVAIGGELTSARLLAAYRAGIFPWYSEGILPMWWSPDPRMVLRAADLISMHDISLDLGPTRHGITRGRTIYFFDPLGTRNEVFTGGYRPDPDFPTITWTEDNIGRAVFYYEGELNNRFMKVHT